MKNWAKISAISAIIAVIIAGIMAWDHFFPLGSFITGINNFLCLSTPLWSVFLIIWFFSYIIGYNLEIKNKILKNLEEENDQFKILLNEIKEPYSYNGINYELIGGELIKRCGNCDCLLNAMKYCDNCHIYYGEDRVVNQPRRDEMVIPNPDFYPSRIIFDDEIIRKMELDRRNKIKRFKPEQKR